MAIQDLLGIRINQLQVTPSLNSTTKIVVQDGLDTTKAATIDTLENYLDVTNKIDFAFNSHLTSTDPHGDRAYSVAQLNLHKNELDAHGHKTYTDNSLTIHTQGLDPHGDRSYALGLMTTHNALTDPHGHKAYTIGEVSGHNLDVNAHNIDDRIETAIDDTRGVVNGFAPLDSNLLISSAYLPTTSNQVIFVTSLPATGVVGKLYINYSDDKQYYWTGAIFKELSNFSVGGVSLTTDDVAESTINLNRRYYTTLIETGINSAINTRINIGANLGTGLNVYKEKVGSTLNFRTLLAGDGITLNQTANSIEVSLAPVSSIENEPIDFSTVARTYVGELTNYLTTDGLVLNTTTYAHTMKYPTHGLTHYKGRIIVAKIKQGSGLEQIGKYNKIEEMRTWEVSFIINSHQEWDSADDPEEFSNIAAQTITEDLTNGLTTTGPTVSLNLHNDSKSVLIQCTSPNIANYVYLWKGTFKKTYLLHDPTGTIEHG